MYESKLGILSEYSLCSNRVSTPLAPGFTVHRLGPDLGCLDLRPVDEVWLMEVESGGCESVVVDYSWLRQLPVCIW